MNVLTATLLTLVLTSTAQAAGPPAFWSEDLTGIQAVAGSREGALATARMQEKGKNSAIRLRIPPETSDRFIQIKGTVRSLLFTDEGATLLAVVQKQSRRTAWDTYLLKIDTATAKTSRLMTLPRSSAGMAIWPGARHLLVACDQEIRSFTLPDYRSGPLYVLPGGNLALAHHSGPLVLVGRTDNLVLVNLEDSQAEDQLPIRQQFGLASPLRWMTLSSDAARLYAVTLDGDKLEQPLDVLDLSAAVSPRLTMETEPEPEPIQEPVAAKVPAADLEPETEPVPEPDPVPAPRPATEPETESENPTEPEPVLTPNPAPDAEPVLTAAPPEPERTDTQFQLFGSLAGAMADRVEWVVILGPDNILRERARVRPDAGGRWGVEALPPGRYRIVLDGGGDHALVSSPRFITIQVEEGDTLEAPPFDVQRVR